jgi:hypothetical protein
MRTNYSFCWFSLILITNKTKVRIVKKILNAFLWDKSFESSHNSISLLVFIVS